MRSLNSWIIYLLLLAVLGVYLVPPLVGADDPLTVPVMLVLVLVVPAAVLLVSWLPWTALVIGVAVPLVQTVADYSLLLHGAAALLFVATLRCWGSSRLEARKGAALIITAGLCSVVIGAWLSTAAVGSNGVVAAVVYGTMLGVAAAVIGPDLRVVTVVVAAVGIVASVTAMANPRLSTYRTSIVLGENANGIGLLAALGLVAGVIMILYRGAGIRVAGIGALAICTVGLIDSGSRGGLISALAGFAVIACHRVAKNRTISPGLMAVLTIAVIGIAVGPMNSIFIKYVGRAQDGAEANIVARQSALWYALEQGLSSPLRGVGLGQLGEVSRADSESGLGLRAHNVFADVFAESGLLTLLAVLAVCVAACVLAWRHSPTRALPLVVAVLASVISLDWWGASRTGPVALLILGTALGLGAGARSPEGAPIHVDTASRAGAASTVGAAAASAPTNRRSRLEGVHAAH